MVNTRRIDNFRRYRHHNGLRDAVVVGAWQARTFGQSSSRGHLQRADVAGVGPSLQAVDSLLCKQERHNRGRRLAHESLTPVTAPQAPAEPADRGSLVGENPNRAERGWVVAQAQRPGHSAVLVELRGQPARELVDRVAWGRPVHELMHQRIGVHLEEVGRVEGGIQRAKDESRGR